MMNQLKKAYKLQKKISEIDVLNDIKFKIHNFLNVKFIIKKSLF